MGAAEVGRELGDVGGPMLVAALASIAGLGAGLLGLAVGLLPRWPCGHPTTVGLSRISCKPCATGSNPTSGGRRVGVVGNQVLGLAHAILGWFGAAPSSPSTTSSLAMVGDQAGAARRPCADVHPPQELATLLRPLLRPAA